MKPNMVQEYYVVTPEDREMRQMERCHSESVIYERKAGKPKSKLDSRIYPAWWGEPSFDKGGVNRPVAASGFKQMAESSLERGMREVR